MLGYLLSKPDGWEVRFWDLIAQGPLKRDGMRRVLHELETFGYMRRTRTQGERGRIQWVTVIYESPVEEGKEDPAPETDSPSTANPATVAPSVDSPATAGPPTGKPSIYRIVSTTSSEQRESGVEGEGAAKPRARPAPRKVECSGCRSQIPVLPSSEGEIAYCPRCRSNALSGEKVSPADDVDADTGRCLEFYKHKFREAFEREPHVRKGKDFAILRNLVKEYDKKTVQGFIVQYLASSDEGVKKAGYTIAFFPSQINSLIVSGNGRASPLPAKVQKTASNLQGFVNRGKS